jgi:hypothetical protein
MATYQGGNPRPALAEVNKRAGSADNCGVAVLVVQDTQKYDTIVRKDGTWRYIEVQVLAQIQSQGPSPVVYLLHSKRLAYTAIKETAAPVEESST